MEGNEKKSSCADIPTKEKLHTLGLGLPEVKIMCFCLFLPYYQAIRDFISTDVTYP